MGRDCNKCSSCRKYKNDCRCRKSSCKKNYCNSCHKSRNDCSCSSHHGYKKDYCNSCHKHKNDCGCHHKKEYCPPPRVPLQTLYATLEPSVDTADGYIADVLVPLDPTAPQDEQYRPPYDPCDQREVCVSASVVVTGGTATQVVTLGFGVKYDSGFNQFYPVEPDCAPQPITVPAGQTVTLNFSSCAKLDKSRILFVYLKYYTGETPTTGGIIYTPPTTTTNVTVNVYALDNKS